MHDTLVWHPSLLVPPEPESIFESLPKALNRAATQWPNRPAVWCAGLSYTFNDLAGRAAGLADEINTSAHQPGPVALVQSVGFDAIAAWFACALAGRPLVLLEPDQPPARLQELMEAAGCVLVVGDQETAPVLMNLPGVKLLMPQGSRGVLSPVTGLGADAPALIFPTSGSTGTPKLVTYSATTLAVMVQSSLRLMGVPDGASVVIAGSHGNYGFLHHAFVFLMSGGTLCLTDVKAGGFAAVLAAIEQGGARHVRFTPSMFRKLATWPQAREALQRLDAVRFSGEPLLATDLTLAQAVLNPQCLIQNVYGSTESALFIWSNNDGGLPAGVPTVPIGHLYPLAAFAISPLEQDDSDANTGELLIRSAFHALGDFKEGAVDQTRFPPATEGGPERLFATGDIVRRLPDGSLVHLGRMGRMVKIRGHRVFLAEVENHLRALPGVTGAAVVERTEADGPVLYGFITSGAGSQTAQQASAWLATRLPDFMRLREVLKVAQIPLLPGGKVDYLGLLARVPAYVSSDQAVIDREDDFGRLVQVWDEVLWAGAHANDADFVELGGDSLKLMTLSIEVEQIFGKSLPLEAFMVDSTLRNLAALLGISSSNKPLPEPEAPHAKRVWSAMKPSWGYALAVRLHRWTIQLADFYVRLVTLGASRLRCHDRVYASVSLVYPLLYWVYRFTRPAKHHATFRLQLFKTLFSRLQKKFSGYEIRVQSEPDNHLLRCLRRKQQVVVVCPHLRLTTMLGYYLERQGFRLAVVANSDPNEEHLNFGMSSALDFIRADSGSLLHIRKYLRAGTPVLVMPDYEKRSAEKRLTKYISPHIFECIEKLHAVPVFMWVDFDREGQVVLDFVEPQSQASAPLVEEFNTFIRNRMPWNVKTEAKA